MDTPSSSSNSIPPASDRIAVVVNGNAKNVTEEVISTLHQILLGGDLFVSRRIEEIDDIAKTLIARGYGTVLTGGGDGTFSVTVTSVVKEARRRQRPLPRFGFLKLGTGNALAYVVGASPPRGTGLAADIQRLRDEAGSRPIRLIEVEGALAPFCGFGFDALVLLDYEKVRNLLANTPLKGLGAGSTGYMLSAVTRTFPSMFFRAMPQCRIINEGTDAFKIGPGGALVGRPIPRGEVIYAGPARICGASTIPYYGFGFRAFPFAEERADMMSLRVTTLGPFSFAKNFKEIWSGEYQNEKYMIDFLAQDVTISMDPPSPFQLGGDIKGVRAQVRVAVTKERIRLVDYYAPPSAA